MLAHLERSGLSLSLQDVTLQILWSAQRSDQRSAACAAQSTLLCDFHHILLLEQDHCHTCVLLLYTPCFSDLLIQHPPDCSWPY